MGLGLKLLIKQLATVQFLVLISWW